MTGGLKKNVAYSSAVLVLLTGMSLLRPALEGQLSQPTMLQLRSQLNLLAGNYQTAVAQAQEARAQRGGPTAERKTKTCTAPQSPKKVPPKHS